MYEYAGIIGVDPAGFSYGELIAMTDSYMRHNWLMFGRLNVDLINSQRTRREQISPIGLYPYFEKPKTIKATAEDERRLAEQLKNSKWLTVEMT